MFKMLMCKLGLHKYKSKWLTWRGSKMWEIKTCKWCSMNKFRKQQKGQ